MSSGICHNYSTAVEAAIHCWFSTHLWALPSLWASLSAATMWLWMVWASIFCCREVQGHQESLENAKSMLQLCPFPGHAEASHFGVTACVLPQDWGLSSPRTTSELVNYQPQGRYSTSGQCVLKGGMWSGMTGRVFLFFWLNKLQAFLWPQSVALPSS